VQSLTLQLVQFTNPALKSRTPKADWYYFISLLISFLRLQERNSSSVLRKPKFGPPLMTENEKAETRNHFKKRGVTEKPNE
jgi:hypothetical protein